MVPQRAACQGPGPPSGLQGGTIRLVQRVEGLVESGAYCYHTQLPSYAPSIPDLSARAAI
jgi:hypothetical protein